jgi:hypothetical protein
MRVSAGGFKMDKRHLAFVAGLMGLCLTAAAPANATVYDFFDLTFTQVGTPGNGCCGPFDVTAVLKTTPIGNNFEIVDIQGTVFQGGTPLAITGLIPAPNDPGDYMAFDNLVFSTGGGAPYNFDSGGVGFYASGVFNYYPADPAAAFNVWGNGGTSGTLATTASYDVNTNFNGTYSIVAATPLPSTWTMLIAGFIALGFFACRGTKKDSAAVAAA